MCKAETIIDEKNINYTKVEIPSLLLSLTQISFNKYSKKIGPDTVIIVDEEIDVPLRLRAKHERFCPCRFSVLQREVIKNPMAANIIAVGAVNEALQIASVKSLEEAVLNHIPKGTEELNIKAMRLGAELVKQSREEDKKVKRKSPCISN